MLNDYSKKDKMEANSYVDALRNSKTSDTQMRLSPRRQIVEKQKRRCYMCEKTLENITCYFTIVEGPDMITGINSKELRAICPNCFFALGKDPVKEIKKSKDSEREKERAKQKKSEEEEEQNLFKELKLKHNTKDEMYDEWK
jgi:hypothetical protein